MKHSSRFFLSLCLISFMAISTDGWAFQSSDTTSRTMQNTKVVADGAIPRLISKQFAFTEGPTADKKGNIFLQISQTIRSGSMTQMEI